VLCQWETVKNLNLTSQSYGKGVTEVKRAAFSREGKTIDDVRPNEYKGRSEKQFWDPNMIDESTINKQDNKEEIIEFLRLLAVCHTVIIEKNPETHETLLSAASPDELALVNGAKYLGVEFIVNSIIPFTISRIEL
jgi:magnesium-transporting ATPase (P-type)